MSLTDGEALRRILGPEPVVYSGISLTEPGTASAIRSERYKYATCELAITSINTSVALRLEGSLTNSGWFNLDPQDEDYTVSGNGTYAIQAPSLAGIPYIRLRFASETGGTSANISAIIRLSNW